MDTYVSVLDLDSLPWLLAQVQGPKKSYKLVNVDNTNQNMSQTVATPRKFLESPKQTLVGRLLPGVIAVSLSRRKRMKMELKMVMAKVMEMEMEMKIYMEMEMANLWDSSR